VRYWFKHQHTEEHIAQGRAKLDKELHRSGVGAINQEKIAQKLHFNKLDDCLNAIGRGDVSEHQIANAIQEVVNPKPIEKTPHQVAQKTFAHTAPTEVILEGVGNLQTNLARCCNPTYPDAIIAYVTRDRGVTVHRQQCSFIKRLEPNRHDRLLNAQWQTKKN
jgi:GTP pyrophosphokinase